MDGLSEETVEEISSRKKEPQWMREWRLEALAHFRDAKLPGWGPDLGGIDFSDVGYYLSPGQGKARTWGDVEPELREKFERLKVPDAERKFLAGLEAQLESEAIYGNLKKEWEKKGVIFTNMETGVRERPELLRKYLGTVVRSGENPFAALTNAVWSGGSFVYVPRGVEVTLPLHAFFLISKEGVGQFERTLIVAEEGSSLHYVEGCTAPFYQKANLHTGVVEVVAEKGSDVRYTTLQNWSKNVYNLVTQRAVAKESARMAWVDGNLGSRITMKYPGIVLAGEGAKGEIISISIAAKGQEQDSGGRALHLAPETSSSIVSKGISSGGGVATFRADVRIEEDAKNCSSFVKCNGLMLDGASKNNSIPGFYLGNGDSFVSHEASAGRLSERKLFYLMSRGLTRSEAEEMIVLGFFRPFMDELPFEYAVEFNRLLQMEIEGAAV